MGQEIYYVFQRRDGVRWVDVPSTFQISDDYALFSWLGSGNGDKIGTCHIESIARLRGLPDDFDMVDKCYHPIAPDEQGRCLHYMGEWGYSSLLASDILEVSPPRVLRTVRTAKREYEEWDWSDDVPPWQWACADWGSPVGPPDRITHEETAVAAEWIYDFAEEFRFFTDEIRRLSDTYGEIRFVFGFG